MRKTKRPLRAHPPTALIAILTFACCASQAASAATEVIVRKGGPDQVTVRYQVSEPVNELIFAVDAPAIRSGYWSTESTAHLQSDRIVAEAPFTEITAILRPNDRFIDRAYASLFTIDRSTAVVNLDYIRLEDPDVTVSVWNAYDPYERACVRDFVIAPALSGGYAERAGRYVMLSDSFEGCLARVKKSPDRIFFSSGLSPVIADTVSRAFRPVYGGLQEQFGVTPEPEPTLFLSHDPAAGNDSYQADVGWNSSISLRFHGDAWSTPDSAAEIRSTLTHELVHLWIGKLVRIENADGTGDAWLHEGAAEYIALLTLARQGRITRDDFRTQLGSRLTACGRDLDARPLLSDRRPAFGQVIYDCGVLVQFVYDVVGRSGSGGGGSVVDLWRELIGGSREDGSRTLDAARFIDSEPEAKAVLSSVLYGPEADTAAIAAALAPYGVDSVTRQSTDVRTIAAELLIPFLRADCSSGSFGFWTNEDHLKLDANESCASVPAGFVVRQVEGIDLLERPGAAYNAAARACAAGGSLRLAGRTPEEPELRLRCPETLPAHPVDVEIRAIAFLQNATAP